MITSAPEGARRSRRVGLSRVASCVTTTTRWASDVQVAGLAQPGPQRGAAGAAAGEKREQRHRRAGPERQHHRVPVRGRPGDRRGGDHLAATDAGPVSTGNGADARPAECSSSAARRRRMSAWLRSSATM